MSLSALGVGSFGLFVWLAAPTPSGSTSTPSVAPLPPAPEALPDPTGDLSLIAPKAIWEKVHGELKFSEGPAWTPAGELLFEDTPRDRTMKLDKKGQVSVFREDTAGANGQAFDQRGRLIVCEGNSKVGGRRVARVEKDGTLTTLAERFEGKRLNSPNDLTIDKRGRIYFTDPRYSQRENLELDKEGVYRIDGDGKLTRIIDSLTRPNGILVTPDARTLYIADNASPGGVVTLWAFDLDDGGNASKGRVLYDFGGGRGIDGMALDRDGRIWATAGTKEKAGIYVFAPDKARATASLAATLPMPEDPTNATFGGKDRSVLYVTTTASLFRIKTTVRGVKSPPASKPGPAASAGGKATLPDRAERKPERRVHRKPGGGKVRGNGSEPRIGFFRSPRPGCRGEGSECELGAGSSPVPSPRLPGRGF